MRTLALLVALVGCAYLIVTLARACVPAVSETADDD